MQIWITHKYNDFFFLILDNSEKKLEDKINISPSESRVEIEFAGEGSLVTLSDVPTNYRSYEIEYKSPAKPTIEHFNAVLQWKNAIAIGFDGDDGFMATNIQQHFEEFCKLVKLEDLTVTYDEDTYDNINVAALIESLPSIRRIFVMGKLNLKDAQINEFFSNSVIPSNWEFFTYGNDPKESNRMFYAFEKKRE